MVILRHPAVGDVIFGCKILFGEVVTYSSPMLIFIIAPVDKESIAIPGSEDPALVLQRSGDNKGRWRNGSLLFM
jgi:hypothetical protein